MSEVTGEVPRRGDFKITSNGYPISTMVEVWDGRGWLPLKFVRSIAWRIAFDELASLELVVDPIGIQMVGLAQQERAALRIAGVLEDGDDT